ncbi:MAG: FecR family protein [Planctomycetota bacterium]
MERHEALLAGYFEGTLTLAEQEALAAYVRGDPGTRRRFAALAEMEGLLWGHFAPEQVRAAMVRRTMSCLPNAERREQTVEHVMARIAEHAPLAAPAATAAQTAAAAHSPVLAAPAGGKGRELGAWRLYLGDRRLWATAAGMLLTLSAALYLAWGRRLIQQHRWDIAALTGVAKLENHTGQVAILTEFLDAKVPAREGQSLAGRDGLEITGSGRAAVTFSDQSRLELVSPHRLARLWLCRPAAYQTAGRTGLLGKRVTLESGILEATVAKQAQDKPMTLYTPQADLEVLGTRFRLAVAGDCTRLEVYEGRVKLTRRADQKSVEAGAQEFAVVCPGVELKTLRSAASPPGTQR